MRFLGLLVPSKVRYLWCFAIFHDSLRPRGRIPSSLRRRPLHGAWRFGRRIDNRVGPRPWSDRLAPVDRHRWPLFRRDRIPCCYQPDSERDMQRRRDVLKMWLRASWYEWASNPRSGKSITTNAKAKRFGYDRL